MVRDSVANLRSKRCCEENQNHPKPAPSLPRLMQLLYFDHLLSAHCYCLCS